jgi:hypothetical protein
MRFLLYVQIPTEAGNSIVQDPNFLQKIEDYINNRKPKLHILVQAMGTERCSLL